MEQNSTTYSSAELEQKTSQDNKKRKAERRTNDQIEKNFMCPFTDCAKMFGS